MPDQPSPLPRGQRRAIEEAAKTDARHRIPDPLVASAPVTTSWREAVWDERDELIANFHVELEDAATRIEKEIAHLIEAFKVATGHSKEAAKTLAEHRARGVQVRRLFGEERTPEKIVQVRRQREHSAKERSLLATLQAHEAHLTAVEGEKHALDVELERLRKHFAMRAHRCHVRALANRRVYDQVLLRYHPLRRELQDALDQEPRPLPAWVLEHMEPEGPQG
jgi:hypothetical protein